MSEFDLYEKRYQRAKERWATLAECLVMQEAIMRRFSANEANIVGKPGYERAYEEERTRRRILQEMMRELRTEMDSLKEAGYKGRY